MKVRLKFKSTVKRDAAEAPKSNKAQAECLRLAKELQKKANRLATSTYVGKITDKEAAQSGGDAAFAKEFDRDADILEDVLYKLISTM